nr:MAG TPA: hypothetical protein [Caudoviricetes sp.]
MTMSAEISAGFRQVAADQIAQDIDNNAKFAKVSALAKVATSGSYNDLTDKPSGGTRKVVTSNSREAVLTAGTAWTVPQHTVGGDELLVWIEGLLCTRGVEYTDASSTTITFTSDIPTDFSLVAEVVN